MTSKKFILRSGGALMASVAAVAAVSLPAQAGPTPVSAAALQQKILGAGARAAITSEANSVLPRLKADGAGYSRDGMTPQLPKGTLTLGALPASTPMSVDLALVPRSPQALAQFANLVATPGSSSYRHYISVRTFAAKYGATRSEISAVRSAMSAAGLKVSPASRNGLEMKVSGTAATFERAFATPLVRVRLTGGRIAFTNTLAPRIANSAARYVSAVVGLNDTVQLAPQVKAAGKPNPNPVSGVLGGVTGALPTGSTGSGTTTTTTSPTTTPTNESAPTTPDTSTVTTPATPTSYANGPTPCAAATNYITTSTAPLVPGTPISGDAPLTLNAYTYDKFSKAYDFNPLYRRGDLGQGVNIGIFELETNFPTDPINFENCYGINTPVSYISVDGPGPAPSSSNSDGLETALDLETISALAPDANITVYQGNANVGTAWIDTFNDIVSDDSDRVVSVSYGACEQLESQLVGSQPQAEVTLFEEAATQGQTISVSSGDAGAEGCRLDTDTQVPAVDDPAADPFVTGVGGTSLASIGNPPATRPTESVWNNGPVLDAADQGGAGGGGLSTLWLMPSYQSDAANKDPGLGVINSESQGAAGQAGLQCSNSLLDGSPSPIGDGTPYYCREVPDVSASADLYNGFAVYYNNAWTTVGGTSGAAPIWSALFADADSDPGCRSNPVGFANPALYAIGSGSNYGSDFNDVTSGNNDEGISNGGDFQALTGYDMASGLGTPVAANLVSDLCGAYANKSSAGSTTQTITAPGQTITEPGTTSTETVTQPAQTVTQEGTTTTETQTVTSPGTTSTETQTVTQPGQTVTEPGSTVTEPGQTTTVAGASPATADCSGDTLTFVEVSAPKTRLTGAKVYVDGKLLASVAGRAARLIKLERPTASHFTVRVVYTLSNGEAFSHQITYNGCSHGPMRVAILHRAHRHAVRHA